MPAPLTCTPSARPRKRNGQNSTRRPQLCGTAASCPRLPPYWEPPTYKTGSCCFCGQLRVLPFAAPTQEEADRYATDKCDCEIGKACRRQREEREIIAGLFAEFEPDTLRLLEATADMVRKGYIKGGTAIKLAENGTAKFKVKDGTVIVTRSEKHEHQHSL